MKRKPILTSFVSPLLASVLCQTLLLTRLHSWKTANMNIEHQVDLQPTWQTMSAKIDYFWEIYLKMLNWLYNFLHIGLTPPLLKHSVKNLFPFKEKYFYAWFNTLSKVRCSHINVKAPDLLIVMEYFSDLVIRICCQPTECISHRLTFNISVG